MPNVVIYLGPARSGKTHELVRQYRDTLRQCRPLAPREERFSRSEKPTLGRALWLAPNARTAGLIRRQVLSDGLDACLFPGIVTFDQLTKTILAETPKRWRPIDSPMQRELLRRVVRHALDQGQLTRFAAAAGRSGFIDLLAEHIQELQRHDISPSAYHKARPTRGDEQEHRELAHLYGEYTGHLAERDLLDTDSAHVAARDALAAGACPRLDNLELIVVDGFTDFTRTQHDILRLLAQHTNHLLVSLPDDVPPAPPQRTGRFSDQSSDTAPPPRSDLFAKVHATLAELKHHHPTLQLRRFAPRPSAFPALDYLSQHVFRHPAHVPPPAPEVLDSLDRIEIAAAAGAQDEILEIARRVKGRLASGQDRPGDIVVVFRSLAEVAARVREVFNQFGIPYYLESSPLLAMAPVVKTLLALLRLDAEDWPFRRIISVVTNNSLTAFDAGARRAADWLVRDLQIAQGRATLRERVDQLAADPESPNQTEYAARRSTAARQAKPLFAQLAEAIDRLPQEATLTQWCQALTQTGASLGLSPSNDATDLVAWQSIERHFVDLERLDTWLGQPPRPWSRRELIGALADVATHESLPAAHDEVGCVRVLAAPAARNISARHLFLAGMSEQAFPSPERARLATEADYHFAARVADQELAELQLDSATRSQAEILLFYEVLSRAGESLTISYPALDDKAQTLPPSPYVLEIERMLGDSAMRRVRRSTPHLSPVPREASAGSLGDWRVQAVAQALNGERRLLAGLFSDAVTTPLADAIDAGIRIVHARARGDSFGPAEGLLTSPAVVARLAQRFGPQHLWSPSQWETYAACPFKFFLQGVLGLEPLGDLVLETDFARRGSRLHHVLATFHRQWTKIRAEQSLTVADEAAEFLDHLHKVIDERIADSSRGGIDAALLELDCRQIRKWAADHFDHDRKYHGACAKLGGQMSPSHFEFRFGPPRPGDTDYDPGSTNDAFLLDIDGETIRVTGQIDRIDVATIDGQTYFNVIDYKSGKKVSLKQEQIDSGERLQLPIYVEAAQSLVFGGDATPLAAGYWSMAGGFDAKGALAVVQEIENAERWETTKVAVRRLVRQFVDSIRRGDFPVHSRDDKCTSYCEFNTVCRITQIRSLNKSWPPSDTRHPTPDT